jgi:transcription elongation factor Elf1
MKNKRVKVEDDYYICPFCDEEVYLDTVEISQLFDEVIMDVKCPHCGEEIEIEKPDIYGSDYYPKL